MQNEKNFSAAKFQIFLGMFEGPSLCMRKIESTSWSVFGYRFILLL